MKDYARRSRLIPSENLTAITTSDATQLSNRFIPYLKIELRDKQDLLEILDLAEQLKKLLRLLPVEVPVCVAEPSTAQTSHAPTIPEVIFTVEAYLGGWKARDIGRILNAVSEDCIFDERPMTMSEIVQGKQRLGEYATSLFTAFPEI